MMSSKKQGDTRYLWVDKGPVVRTMEEGWLVDEPFHEYRVPNSR